MAEKYLGELRKKLLPKREAKKLAAALMGNSDDLRALIRAEIDEQYQKLPALFIHFKIDYASNPQVAFFELAIHLAEAHVPGFQYEQARGAPKRWNSAKRVEAALKLGDLAAKYPDKSLNNLASVLHKQEPWKTLSKTSGALLKQIRLQNYEDAVLKEERAASSTANRLKELMTMGNKYLSV